MTTNTSVPYGKSNAYTLLMRVPTSEATLKFSIQVSQKTKNCTTIRPSDMTPGHVANILCPTTDIYVHPSSLQLYSQQLKNGIGPDVHEMTYE